MEIIIKITPEELKALAESTKIPTPTDTYSMDLDKIIEYMVKGVGESLEEALKKFEAD